jgi:hypothetical protein
MPLESAPENTIKKLFKFEYMHGSQSLLCKSLDPSPETTFYEIQFFERSLTDNYKANSLLCYAKQLNVEIAQRLITDQTGGKSDSQPIERVFPVVEENENGNYPDEYDKYVSLVAESIIERFPGEDVGVIGESLHYSLRGTQIDGVPDTWHDQCPAVDLHDGVRSSGSRVHFRLGGGGAPPFRAWPAVAACLAVVAAASVFPRGL